jgi:ADP-ribosylglycohydrolase
VNLLLVALRRRATASVARINNVPAVKANAPAAEKHGFPQVAHSLEAAIWSVARTSNFEDAVLIAANLGGDARTLKSNISIEA